MSAETEKPPKIGTEITVRISLTFQEAPDVHTLLAMTPVRERGKLVRLALERYIAETGHPAGDVEQQIHAISTWLRSRTSRTDATVCAANQLGVDHTFDAEGARQVRDVPAHFLPRSELSKRAIGRNDPVSEEVGAPSSSIKRWLQV
jgi:hypothetical protein